MRSYFHSRKTILFGIVAGGLAAVYFLARFSGEPAFFRISEKGGTAMAGKAGGGASPRPAAIPPIDAAAHGATETATFALG
jgi:hypothetical protein